jgi:retinol-binding protein 3
MIRFLYVLIVWLVVNGFALAESDKPLDKAQKQAILREISELLTRSYVYPETAAKMIARAINPITKTNWEGTGVAPDISISASKAYDKAYQLALDKLAAKTTDKAKKSQLDWLKIVQEAKINPVQLDSATLSKYTGVYEERKVTLENGDLYYQRRGPKYKLLPVNQTMFIADGVDDVHFEFVVKGDRATEIIGVYSDGSREPSKRTQ